MRILISGGAGFIGSNTVDFLIDKGFEIFIIDNLSSGKEENINRYAKFEKVDILEKEKIEKLFYLFKPDIVFHFAAQVDVKKSIDNPDLDIENNIKGSVNIFDLCVKYRVKRVIFSSSCAVYGDKKNLPIKENFKATPISSYGISKYCAEIYLEYFKKIYKLNRVILRYSNVYGPRQNPFGEAGVVAIFCKNIIKGEKLNIFGDGEQTRDFIFVEDIVLANYKSIFGREGIYNIGTGIETSINELIKYFEKIVNKKLDVNYLPKKEGEIFRISLNSEKAKKYLNFKPRYNIEEGLKRTFDWYKNVLK